MYYFDPTRTPFMTHRGLGNYRRPRFPNPQVSWQRNFGPVGPSGSPSFHSGPYGRPMIPFQNFVHGNLGTLNIYRPIPNVLPPPVMIEKRKESVLSRRPLHPDTFRSQQFYGPSRQQQTNHTYQPQLIVKPQLIPVKKDKGWTQTFRWICVLLIITFTFWMSM